jgi:serine protease SohB
MLDPFLPEKPDEVERLKLVQREIHDDFIALVKERRGARLTGPETDLFSGEYWTGRTAVELGLADSVGELRSVLRERFGDKVITPVIAPERSLLGRVRPGVGLGGIGLGGLEFGGIGGDGFADELISALEARALWARYGL